MGIDGMAKVVFYKVLFDVECEYDIEIVGL